MHHHTCTSRALVHGAVGIYVQVYAEMYSVQVRRRINNYCWTILRPHPHTAAHRTGSGWLWLWRRRRMESLAKVRYSTCSICTTYGPPTRGLTRGNRGTRGGEANRKRSSASAPVMESGRGKVIDEWPSRAERVVRASLSSDNAGLMPTSGQRGGRRCLFLPLSRSPRYARKSMNLTLRAKRR